MDAGLDFFGNFWVAVTQWQIPLMTLYAVVAVSCISTVLTSRMTGGIPYVTMPAGFVIMYSTAYLANFLGRDIILPTIDAFQRGVIFAIVGHCLGGLIMLLIFKLKEQQGRQY